MDTQVEFSNTYQDITLRGLKDTDIPQTYSMHIVMLIRQQQCLKKDYNTYGSVNSAFKIQSVHGHIRIGRRIPASINNWKNIAMSFLLCVLHGCTSGRE